MNESWKNRPESLGIIVDASADVREHTIGDLLHRIAIRSPREGFLVRMTPETHLRAIPPLLCLGRKVACVVEDGDDICRVARRLIAVSGAHLTDMETAVWNESAWRVGPLVSFV